MSCMLRVSGENLDIGALIAQCQIVPTRVWRKGEPRGSKGKTHLNSGATYLASKADLDQFDVQLQEAMTFLEQNIDEIGEIAEFPGVDSAHLDFGVVYKESFIESTYFPPEFLRLVAKVGIGVEISRYENGADGQRK